MGYHYASKQHRRCPCCKGSMELKIDKNNSFRDVLEHIKVWRMFCLTILNIDFFRKLKRQQWIECPMCEGTGYEEIIVDEERN